MEQRIKELEELVKVQKQYREDCIQSLKKDISKTLKIEYEDFFESVDLPMNEMLGEIYREKIKNIAKILTSDSNLEVLEYVNSI